MLYVSEPALDEVLATGRCEIVRPLHAIEFGADGMLADQPSR